MRERLPEDCSDLIAAATDIVAGQRLDLLGYRGLSFGDPIDWHLDPVWSRHSPRVHWSQIDTLDPAVVGDSKVVWELNRHQWVVRLAQAWALTGDERYANAAIAAIDPWLDANPPGIGVNWASSLEVSYRLISWSWTLLLLRTLPSLTGEWVMKVLSAISSACVARQAVSLVLLLAQHAPDRRSARPLLCGCAASGNSRDAPRWRELGARILLTESRRQITADGVHFEQSTCYQRYTIDIYLHFLLLAARNGISVPPALSRERPAHGGVPVVGAAAQWIDSAHRRRRRRRAAAAHATRAGRWAGDLRGGGGHVRSIGLRVGGGRARAGSAVAARAPRRARVRGASAGGRRSVRPRACFPRAATPSCAAAGTATRTR